MLELVISGGQTGVDQAAWRAAKAAGIATGGWMPGFITENPALPTHPIKGFEFHPEFADLYGARSYTSSAVTMAERYRERSKANVAMADAVLVFNLGKSPSPGTKLTLGSSDRLGKPKMLVTLLGRPMRPNRTASDVASWIAMTAAKSLMVAGNRESSSPGIGEWAEAYLSTVFSLLQEPSHAL